jgi:uncharacterized membrane protein YdjX (TVP38/TMEM64 family)
MTGLRLCVWKEWREQRGPLAAMAVILPVLIGIVGACPAKRHVANGLFVGVVTTIALVLVAAVVGSELLGAGRWNANRWLERLPCGRETAFAAKLLFSRRPLRPRSRMRSR